MKFGGVIEGLQIFAKYEDDGLDTFLAGADHDVIWACSAKVESVDVELVDSRISSEDAEKLKELGWFISKQYDNCWTAFV